MRAFLESKFLIFSMFLRGKAIIWVPRMMCSIKLHYMDWQRLKLEKFFQEKIIIFIKLLLCDFLSTEFFVAAHGKT